MRKENDFFENLLGSFSRNDFFEQYWGKQVLYLDRSIDPVVDFPISIATINDFFANERLRHPWVKLVKEGSEIPLKEYRNNELSQLTDFIDNNKLFAYLNKGATIVANSIDKTIPTIGLYCRQLEKELAVKVWANLYISPPNSRGFGIHQDIHDVIVIQLEGEKNWRIFPREKNLGPRQPGPSDHPEQEFVLKKGEMVYLPKNYPHMAFATDSSPSVHLSLGFEGLFWKDIVKHFANEIIKDQDFEQRVPIPMQGKDQYKKFIHDFQKKWEELNQDKHPLDFIEQQNAAVHHQKSAQNGNRLSDYLAINHLKLQNKLRKKPYVAYKLNSEGKTVSLSFHGKEFSFPVFINSLLEKLLQDQPYCLEEIEVPQSDQEKLMFAKKLIQEGILEVVLS